MYLIYNLKDIQLLPVRFLPNSGEKSGRVSPRPGGDVMCCLLLCSCSCLPSSVFYVLLMSFFLHTSDVRCPDVRDLLVMRIQDRRGQVDGL